MGVVALFERNRSVPSLSEVVSSSESATSNNAVKQTEFVADCFLQFQRAAAYFKR